MKKLITILTILLLALSVKAQYHIKGDTIYIDMDGYLRYEGNELYFDTVHFDADTAVFIEPEIDQEVRRVLLSEDEFYIRTFYRYSESIFLEETRVCNLSELEETISLSYKNIENQIIQLDLIFNK